MFANSSVKEPLPETFEGVVLRTVIAALGVLAGLVDRKRHRGQVIREQPELGARRKLSRQASPCGSPDRSFHKAPFGTPRPAPERAAAMSSNWNSRNVQMKSLKLFVRI